MTLWLTISSSTDRSRKRLYMVKWKGLGPGREGRQQGYQFAGNRQGGGQPRYDSDGDRPWVLLVKGVRCVLAVRMM